MVTYAVTYLRDFKMEGLEMLAYALAISNIAYNLILYQRRMSRKRKRSCWAHEWLLDRDNPAKKNMIDLYSDWYQVYFACTLICILLHTS